MKSLKFSIALNIILIGALVWTWYGQGKKDNDFDKQREAIRIKSDSLSRVIDSNERLIQSLQNTSDSLERSLEATETKIKIVYKTKYEISNRVDSLNTGQLKDFWSKLRAYENR